MRFIDEVKITIASGKGGDGSASFRREKFIPFGGPDGGNGGRGGHIYFVTNRNLNTLMHFRGKRNYHAPHGQNGQGRQKDGRSGEDLYLEVPVGTLIKDANTGEILFDLKDEGQTYQAATGGRGGLGNVNFKSSTNQAPRYAQEGDEGEEFELTLELKLLADVALIGLPNAGKSTLISRITSARPKVADYPFTTLVPNLGVVEDQARTLVVADVPGLIENASEGKGLGHKFLKHIERTKILVHLIDISKFKESYDYYLNYVTIKSELQNFNPELLNKRELICLTKIDALPEDEIQRIQSFFEQELDKKVLPISSVSGRNIDTLIHLMFKALEK